MDPRLLTPDQRRDTRSDLMKMKERATKGEKVNVCPFGCDVEDIDENGYCDHLVGFTNEGPKAKFYEPMIFDEHMDRRIVRVAIDRKTKQPILEPIQKGDVLVQITVSHRVYRNVEKPAKSA